MDASSRIVLAPRTLVLVWLAAVLPAVAGLATGGLAAVLGAAFAIACPLLAVVGARWPLHAPRAVPLYFGALFLASLTSLEFNSFAFVVDTWSALLLGLLTMKVSRPPEIDGDTAGRPQPRRSRAFKGRHALHGA